MLTDKQAAFDFLKKIKTTVVKDKQAAIRVTSGLIELHLANKDATGCCVDIAQIRVCFFLSPLLFLPSNS